MSGRPPRRARGLAALSNLWPLRGIIAARARKTVARKDPQGHYPAPLAIIDIWERHQGNALLAPHLLARIIQSPTARNLLRVFRLQERLKAHARGESGIGHVHVIGAGVMGGDIAAWCAYKGLDVTLQDTTMERIAPALKRAGALFGRRLKDRRAARAAFDRLIPDPQGAGVARADLVIEPSPNRSRPSRPSTARSNRASSRGPCWPPTPPACRWPRCAKAWPTRCVWWACISSIRWPRCRWSR